MLVASWILLLLASLVALGNLTGVASALWRQRHGDPRNFSCVPLVSLLLAALAWLAGRETLGLWTLLPAAIDPGTWMLAALPFVIASAIFRRNAK